MTPVILAARFNSSSSWSWKSGQKWWLIVCPRDITVRSCSKLLHNLCVFSAARVSSGHSIPASFVCRTKACKRETCLEIYSLKTIYSNSNTCEGVNYFHRWIDFTESDTEARIQRLTVLNERLYCPACRTYEIATRFWVVVICPIIKCLTVLEFSFILFDLCLFITIFNFILNYVLIVTFWIFTYHKIWILLIIYCFIWNYWIIYFLTCLEVFWSVVS